MGGTFPVYVYVLECVDAKHAWEVLDKILRFVSGKIINHTPRTIMSSIYFPISLPSLDARYAKLEAGGGMSPVQTSGWISHSTGRIFMKNELYNEDEFYFIFCGWISCFSLIVDGNYHLASLNSVGGPQLDRSVKRYITGGQHLGFITSGAKRFRTR